jgi:hypothetical protein
MARAEVRLIGVSDRKESIREQFNNAVFERGDIVIHSALESSEPLNEHLVWLWTSLQGKRRFLKNLQQCGGKLVCHCKVSKGSIHLRPNAAEMLHLLDMELVLEVR